MHSTEKASQVTDSGRAIAWLYTLPVVCAVLAAAFYSQFLLTHDSSWYLIATRKFLEGQRLYLDIIEINPPLNFYLTVPALIIADIAGTSDTLTYILYYCAMAGASGLWAARIVAYSSLANSERFVFVMTGIVGLFLLPISEFTQREHIMLIFALPYFYLTILGGDRTLIGKFEQFAMGLVAAFGIALKPYFLLIPLALVLTGSWRELFKRAFSPANLGLALGLVLYALFVLVFHLEYFTEIVPIATRVYGAYGTAWPTVILRSEATALILFIVFLWNIGTAPDEIGKRALMASIGGLSAYLIQFKGWNYQLLPFSFFLVLGTAWLANRHEIFQKKRILPSVLIIGIVIFTGGKQFDRGPYDATRVESFIPFIDRPSARILVYSTNVWAGFPFTNAVGGQWSSRFPAQWVIPGALIGLNRTDCAEQPRLCREFTEVLEYGRDANTEDFLRYRPEFVFVDERASKSYFGGLAFDYIAFMKKDPRFAEAWSKCSRIGTVDRFEYGVWRCAPPDEDGRAN